MTFRPRSRSHWLAAAAAALSIAFAAPTHAGAYEDFFKAVSLDDAAAVERLLQRGFDANSVDEAGQGALFLAMREGAFKVAATLLKSPGLKVDQANSAGETALMMAALRGHGEWLPQLVAQGAANVVQTYYAHLEQGEFRKAWLLWGGRGEASGMTAQAFAASFGKYSEYHANIGAPGEIDAGAGQRYVTVPVQVYGRLKEGNRPFYMLGSVTLHRTEVDGASAEQRSWRIRSADIKPRPGEAEPPPAPSPSATVENRSNARYRCIDGSRIAVAFDPDRGIATVSRAGRRLATLRQQRVASGISYAGGGYELRGKGDDLDFTAPGLPPLPCTAIR